MRKVYEAISDMLLPAAVFAAIAAALVGGSLLHRIGQRMEPEPEMVSREAAEALEELCERKTPVIRCTGKKRWSVGETLLVSGQFAAEDAEGSPIGVLVEEITDKEGNSVMEDYQKDTQSLTFSGKGVYTFFLKAMDEERKSSTWKCSIVVNEDRRKL